MIPLSDEPDTDREEAVSEDEEAPSREDLTPEETIIQWIVTVLVPFLITFIAFGVIILAYSEWKLY